MSIKYLYQIRRVQTLILCLGLLNQIAYTMKLLVAVVVACLFSGNGAQESNEDITETFSITKKLLEAEVITNSKTGG